GYRRGGVYVLLGGAGGIGEVFSEYLIREYQAQVIWIGRRPEDEAIEAKRARLGTLGPAPYYLSADATNHVLLQAAYEAIKERFGVIHGVVHSVLVLQDQSLMRMEEKTFVGSLEAKVDVSVRLAEVFGREALDFVLFLSSILSVSKGPGQSNYSAGCTFTDSYAQALSRMWSCEVKVVSWAFWGSVGAVASPAYRDQMARIGVDSIEPPEAMDVLERLLASPVSRVIYIKTTQPALAQALGVVAGRSQQVVPATGAVMQALPRESALELPPSMPAEMKEELEGMLAELLRCQFHELGLFAQPVTDVGAWKAQVGLPSLYGRWLVESLGVLEKRGYLAREGDVLKVLASKASDRDDLWSRWDAYKLQVDSGYRAQVRFVDVALRALPDILRGQRAATEVLFPNGSMELVEGIYRDNEVSDYFNEVLAESLVAAVKARLAQDPQAKLRLFEIGAGTGGTSALLFDRLAPYAAHIEEYCYTDVSKAFLLYAEKQYRAKAPYLKTRIFDVERSLAEQGVEVGRYDVVIATNVLHATREIRRTVRNTKALLKANGVVLINEMSSNSLFLQLTFGLLEGWWLSEDVPLRIPGSPALTPQAWRRLLEAQGFVDVRHPAALAHGLGQQILVGRSDGVVRQHAAVAATPSRRTPALEAALPPAPVRTAAAAKAATGDTLEQTLQSSLVRGVSELLKLKAEEVDPEAELSEFGFDSITLTAFANVINEKYALELTPTVFFEHPTLARLSGHLLREHGAELASRLGVKARTPVVETALAEVEVASDAPRPPSRARPLPARDEVPPRPVEPAAAEVRSGDYFAEKLQSSLVQAVSELLKLDPIEVDPEAELSEFGFDSITLTAFANAINEKYGLELTPTVFFEHPTLAGLGKHLMHEHRAELAGKLGGQSRPPAGEADPTPAETMPGAPRRAHHARFARAADVPQEKALANPESAPVLPRAETGGPLDIAIIGISGSYPQARTLDEFWHNLAEGVDCVTEVPSDRWDHSHYFDPEKARQGKTHGKWGGFIDGVHEFDSDFFNISHDEALIVDPQVRLFLQTAYHALENAGVTREQISSKYESNVGVYVGSMYKHQVSDGTWPDDDARKASLSSHMFISSSASIANRTSHVFGFEGPSVVVDTMSSSAATAIHLACRDLAEGVCTLAIAGGVNLSLHQDKYIALSQLNMIGSHPGSRSFSSGDGYLPSECVGAVILKPLHRAVEDGDAVLAVVKGIESRHAGRSISYGTPNVVSQERLVESVLRSSNSEEVPITYVEATSNGVPIVDDVEAAVLRKVFSSGRYIQESCVIGSVKSNIGHPEAASGIAQLTKVVLQMMNKKIAPIVEVGEIREDLNSIGLARRLMDWAPHRIDARDGSLPLPRRALINTFGAGGSCVSMVVEEYAPSLQEQPAEEALGDREEAILLSAHTAEQLQAVIEQFLIYARRNPDIPIGDLAYTLQLRRTHMRYRWAAVVRTVDELIAKLEGTLEQGASDPNAGPSSEDSVDAVNRLRKIMSGNVGRQVSKTLLEDRDINGLAGLWQMGIDVPWAQLSEGKRAIRLSLPSYPFARKSLSFA
ncbi:Methyltransferase domain-containing protein, partial [Variovorax sp. NFACC28]